MERVSESSLWHNMLHLANIKSFSFSQEQAKFYGRLGTRSTLAG